MTLSEFQAWFEGFSEGIDKVPTEKQWAKIKEKMGDIDDKPISYPVYVDRYVRPYRPWYDRYGIQFPTWTSTSVTPRSDGVAHIPDEDSPPKFDSQSAMHAAGQAEARSMAA